MQLVIGVGGAYGDCEILLKGLISEEESERERLKGAHTEFDIRELLIRLHISGVFGNPHQT